MTRVLYIGKFPPLQGGTSFQGLWLTAALARVGCHVDVVSLGAIGGARLSCAITDDDWQTLRRSHPEFRRVRRYELEEEDSVASYSIPETHAYVTRLISLSLERIEAARPSFIIAHYLEPFGVAAASVADITEVPYLLIHAGSDITRLSSLSSRQFAYRSVLKNATLVLSTRSAGRRVLAMGVAPDKVLAERPSLTPRGMFADAAPPADIGDLDRRWDGAGLPHRVQGAPLQPGKPAVACVGKVGERKGSFDLLRALGQLRAKNRSRPHLIFVTEQQSPKFERLRALVRELGLEDEVTFLPFLPQWRLREVYARCSAVAFLENQFPVGVHRPQVPREAAAAGLALILSREVAAYQRSTRPIVHGTDALVVGDPTAVADVTEALALVAADQVAMEKLSRAASTLYRWPSAQQEERWIRGVLDLMVTTSELRRQWTVSVDEFNSTLIRLYADKRFRREVGTDPDLLRSITLSPTERQTLAAVVDDSAALERYCASLMNKKYAFLARHFRDAFKQQPSLEAAVRETFMARWVLEEAPLDEEISRFLSILLEQLPKVGNDAAEMRATLALSAAQASALFVAVEKGRRPDWTLAASPVHLASHCQLIQTEASPLQSRRDARGGRWCAVVFPDLVEFEARVLEISSELFDVLASLRSPLPLAELAVKLQQLTGDVSVQRVRGVIDRLGEMGILLGSAATRSTPGICGDVETIDITAPME